MIFDMHSHAWDFASHFEDKFLTQLRDAPGTNPDLSADYDDYCSKAPVLSKSIVFGGKARLSGIWVDDTMVAEYVSRNPERLVGFLSADPTREGWLDDILTGVEKLDMRGIHIYPMNAGFHASDKSFDRLWSYAQSKHLPIVIDSVPSFVTQSHLRYGSPLGLDTIAHRFPEARVIVAHMGHPYERECVAMLEKHPHIYADISGLHHRPFELYQTLVRVQEHGVWDKVLFGSDYPFHTVSETIAGLRHLNDMVEGTPLPQLDEGRLDSMIRSNPLPRLGIE